MNSEHIPLSFSWYFSGTTHDKADFKELPSNIQVKS